MTFRIKNKHNLKRKEIKELFNEVNNIFFIGNPDKNLRVEIGIFDDVKIIFIDDDPCFMKMDNMLFFTVKGILKFKPNDRFVVVDMGAVQFITSGADLMAPGIVNADENINVDDQVWICDETHRRPLAVGIAIMNGEEMIKENKGKSVKIFHYVGDKFWNIK
jgi:PUA domain protein